MGSALAQLLTNFGMRRPGATRCRSRARFAVACGATGRIPVDDACAGYAWAWCEAQVAAAVKLVPLGHTAGQRMLLALGARDPGSRRRALLPAATTRSVSSLPGLAIASALHETQYTRLFRS